MTHFNLQSHMLKAFVCSQTTYPMHVWGILLLGYTDDIHLIHNLYTAALICTVHVREVKIADFFMKEEDLTSSTSEKDDQPATG